MEKDWIENTEEQKLARPVPGFEALVDGQVEVDGFLEEDQLLELDDAVQCRVLSTPGHSSGSISLLFAGQKIFLPATLFP